MQIVLKDRASKTVIGKLSFIDLAGSERGADRGETDVKTRYIHFFFQSRLCQNKPCTQLFKLAHGSFLFLLSLAKTNICPAMIS